MRGTQKLSKMENMMTSYDKLKSLPNAKQPLKEGITFKKLDNLVVAL